MKFCYNTSLPFLNNPKDLDPSFKMDLDFWNCFGRKQLHLIDGWMTWDFQQYFSKDDGRLIMKGCVQWNSIYGCEDFALSGDRTWSARSVG